MRIILFGAGGFLKGHFDEIIKLPSTEIIGIVDNNPDLTGKQINGIAIWDVKFLMSCDFDYIVIMSIHGFAIKKQLIQMEIPCAKIMWFEQYVAFVSGADYDYYPGDQGPELDMSTESVLFISIYLGYNGGSMTALYALMALKEMGYKVGLASYAGNDTFIKYVQSIGIEVYICSNLKYAKYSELLWMQEFDHIIVNTYPMYPLVEHLDKERKVLWWLHESPEVYEEYNRMYGPAAVDHLINTDIYCVSQMAENNFKRIYPQIQTGLMEYGIPDDFPMRTKHKKNDKLVFAVIGLVCKGKGQDIFLNAIELLSEEERIQCEFWIVGQKPQGEYSEEVLCKVQKIQEAKVFGEKTHEEIKEMYPYLDVIVCPSREDSLPIVVTEGLMCGKACICSDSIGSIQYFEKDKEAIVFESGNAVQLAAQMAKMIDDRENIKRLNKNARSAYTRSFSMKVFASRLECALKKQNST